MRATAAALAAALAALTAGAAPADTTAGAYVVAGDSVPASLTGMRGNVASGRAVVLDRHVGLCLLCHSGPFPEERFQGTIAPDLKGVGARLSEGQIRLRIIDSGRVQPATIMPAYFRTEGLRRVAPAFRGKTVLTAQQIEDVVAFLLTLRE